MDIQNNKKEHLIQEETLKHYSILKKIGEGAHGIVYKAMNIISNEILVIKKINQKKIEKKNRDSILTEAILLKKLNNQNIITIKSFFYENNNLYIVMEYAENGDLQNYMKKYKKKNGILPEKKIWKLASKIFSGISYIHSKNIIHRDIKPSNIFLDSKNNVKIGDFGVSKYFNNNQINNTRVGTPLYLSPELVQNQNYDTKVS